MRVAGFVFGIFLAHASWAGPIDIRLTAGSGSNGFPVQVFLSTAPDDSVATVQIALEYDARVVSFCCAAIGGAASPSTSELTIIPSSALDAACDDPARTVVVAKLTGNVFTGVQLEVLQFYFTFHGSFCNNEPLLTRFSCSCADDGSGLRWFVHGLNPPHDYCFGDPDLSLHDAAYYRPCSTPVEGVAWSVVKQLFQ